MPPRARGFGVSTGSGHRERAADSPCPARPFSCLKVGPLASKTTAILAGFFPRMALRSMFVNPKNSAGGQAL